MTPSAAPAWSTLRWFNTPEPLTLDALRGRVVMLHAFQMLCPGCVSHGIPQAQRVASQFGDAPVTVVGLHTVFEHHDVMGSDALAVFLHEYRVRFPVAVDHPGPAGDPLPVTMRAYGMRGTPTVVLVDAVGRVRQQVFGAYDELQLGRDLGVLMAEVPAARRRLFGTDRSQPVSAPDGHETGGASEEDEPTLRFSVPGHER
ncbi:MAG: redoxin family protein [Vicinamibacterales bacterium]